MAYRGRGRSRGRGRRGRGRGRGMGWSWRAWEPDPQDYPPLPLIRPIFDWSEVGAVFPQAIPLMDNTLLAQLLTKRVQEITPSGDEQAMIQGFCSKVSTIVENLILTGEGEELMLDEVRGAGDYKKGTALTGETTSDLVLLMKNVPTEAHVSNTMQKLVEVLNMDEKKESDKMEQQERVTLSRTGTNVFELHSGHECSVRVHFTSTGDKVYGPVPDGKDMKPYQDALRMIRHCRWWEEHTGHLKNARNLARLLKDLSRHVPGLRLLEPWHIELLSNCAVIPLVGDEPLSLVDSFKRVWQLLSAGLFLPGSIGIPDPCEETDEGIHETMPLWAMDEITRNAQMILQMLHFGAYQEILGVDGAKPINFSSPYTLNSVTIDVPQSVCDRPDPADPTIDTSTPSSSSSSKQQLPAE